MTRFPLAALALASTLAAGMAQAAVLTESNISTADAQKLATASVAACQAKGYNVSAAVVDRAACSSLRARRQRRPALSRPAAPRPSPRSRPSRPRWP